MAHLNKDRISQKVGDIVPQSEKTIQKAKDTSDIPFPNAPTEKAKTPLAHEYTFPDI